MTRCLRNITFVSTIFCLSFLSIQPAFAWRHDITFAYGQGREYSQNYNNSGYFIDGTLWPYWQIDPTLIFSLHGSVGFWQAHTDINKHNETLALSGAFRAYFIAPSTEKRINPYLQFAIGPSYLAKHFLGHREQGAHWALQTWISGGVEWQFHHHRLQASIGLLHYCNAGLATPNQGYNIPLVIGVGYQFG